MLSVPTPSVKVTVPVVLPSGMVMPLGSVTSKVRVPGTPTGLPLASVTGLPLPSVCVSV